MLPIYNLSFVFLFINIDFSLWCHSIDNSMEHTFHLEGFFSIQVHIHVSEMIISIIFFQIIY